MSGCCTHCGACTRSCLFLQEWSLDLEGLKQSPRHRGCMLCGRCARVCPQGLDGAAIALERRRARGIPLRQWLPYLEKRFYPFRAYPAGKSRSLLFPGCYFPAFFPETMDKLLHIAGQHGVSCASDCCGKPLHDMGRQWEADGIADGINARLEQLGTEELITLCPNCEAYLDGKISVKVVSIYDKLRQWGVPVGQPISGSLFLPCPYRAAPKRMEPLAGILPPDRLHTVENIPCCGLGGGAAAFDRELPKQFAARAKEQTQGELHTCCASCAGQFHRMGIPGVKHLLAELLQVDETPNTGRSFANRSALQRNIGQGG